MEYILEARPDEKMTDKELETLSPWNENIKNVRKVTHSKYSSNGRLLIVNIREEKTAIRRKSQIAVFFNILFYLALTF